MQRTKYAVEFKDEAVKQVVDKGHSVVDVAKRLGIPDGVVDTWVSMLKSESREDSTQMPVDFKADRAASGS